MLEVLVVAPIPGLRFSKLSDSKPRHKVEGKIVQ